MGNSKIFFSYARPDSAFALQLAKDLRNSGADIWMDQLDIRAGTRWDNEVEKALQQSEALLVILSPESANSHNVSDEISLALEEGKRVIPVLHKTCSIPFRIRRIQYADFTNEYENGIAELLKTLELTRNIQTEISTKHKATIEPAEAKQTAITENNPPATQKTIDTQIVLKEEDPVILEFDCIYYSSDLAGAGKTESGNLYLRRDSLEYKTPPNTTYDQFLITNIYSFEFINTEELFGLYKIKVSYYTENLPAEIYFHRLVFLGGFFESPTHVMFNKIQHLVNENKFKLVTAKL